MKQSLYIICFFLAIIIAGVFSCQTPVGNNTTTKKTTDTLLYKNHHDSAKYVGMNTCRLCHQDIYNSFIKTGMGKSFDVATQQKSSGNFKNAMIYDKINDFYYKALWKHDSLRFLEYRLSGKDTIHKRLETVDYIIGSGQHTNSHIQSLNGYLTQMPMTFYTQKQKWDLPPGFENGHNTRFSRKIGLECMSCHNSYPQFVLGSENKYTKVETGIGCERCHGPGSIHVSERSTGSKIDTSTYIDYSIVNPSKLSIDKQFDICQRCHLQGNTILKDDKSFYDFKPGMALNNFMTVFLPKYKNADDQFIMASHADRLKQSKCFIKSKELVATKNSGGNALKPYKDALTCITCHNPHLSVKETNKEVFNDACRNCHVSEIENQKSKIASTIILCSAIKKTDFKTSNCVSCHMPSSGSIDIPHVSVHDHYIRKPISGSHKPNNQISTKEKKEIKEFLGLYAINEKNPKPIIKAKAYLNQYEKFEPNRYYLDSAAFYLSSINEKDIKTNLEPLVQLYFIKQDYSKIILLVNQLTDEYLLNTRLIKQSYSNDHAWACYRIAESLYKLGQTKRAITYFKKSVSLAPYALDFKNKLATALLTVNKLNEAEILYTELLDEYPKHVSALTNLGFVKLQKGEVDFSQTLYLKALGLDPDYEPLLLNLAGLYAYKKDFKQSKLYLERILKKNPNNMQAKAALKQVNTVL